MIHLNYPSLVSFNYTLFKALGIDSEASSNTLTLYKQAWCDLEAHIKNKLQPIYVLDYLSEKDIQFRGKLADKTIDGSYNYTFLSDTIACLFNQSANHQDSTQLIDAITALKNLVPSVVTELPYPHQKIGQTWMISGWVDIADITKLEDLATKFYHELLNQEWQRKKIGKFLDATVFELWRDSPIWDKPEDNSHVLILFYPNQQTMDAAADFYGDWLKCLWYRHKIWFAYGLSRQLKEQLEKDFNRVVPDLEKRHQYNLDQLKLTLVKNLDPLSRYGTNLNLLGIQQQTILTNLFYYKNYVNDIEAKANTLKNGKTDLTFLKEFSRTVEDYYQPQLEHELASFSPGLGALQGLTDTVRGIVEIEQAQRDRNFQNNIAIVGVGLGTASILASIPDLEMIIELPPVNAYITHWQLSKPQANFVVSLNVSIFAGVWVAIFTAIVIKLGELFRSKNSSKQR